MFRDSVVEKGEVNYDPEPFLEAQEGNILICCAQPYSDLELNIKRNEPNTHRTHVLLFKASQNSTPKRQSSRRLYFNAQ